MIQSILFGKSCNRRLAFTLVELIVVISILSILGTIGFLSIQSYSSKSRDTVRLSDVVNISKAVDVIVVERGNAPIPALPVTHTGGDIRIVSGVVSDGTISRLSTGISDPKTKNPYNYAVFGSGTYYQVGVNFENTLQGKMDIPGVQDTYADSENTVSKISGNYQFNPSLPSLFPIATTISSASGGIFSTDACFVLNNSTSNSFSSTSQNCTKTKDLNLSALDNRLLAYWDMETRSGALLKDLSSNGYDATFAGGMDYNVSLTGGKVGKGLLFQGVTNSGYYLNVPKIIPEEYSSQFSMLATIRADSFTGTTSGIWGYFGTGGNNCHFELVSQTELRIRIGNLNKSTIVFSEIGKFIQLSYTYDGIKTIVYINGKKVDEFSGSSVVVLGSSTFSSFQFIGNSHIYPGYNRPFNGVIDDLKIFNRTLSPVEIQQHARIMGF